MEKAYVDAALALIQNWNNKHFNPEETIGKARKIAIILRHGGLYGSAMTILDKCLDVQKSTTQANAAQLGDLYLQQGETMHMKCSQKNALLEWLDPDEQDQAAAVIGMYTLALENLEKAGISKEINTQKALCYQRLAFWTVWQEKLKGDSESSLKKAQQLACEAKDMFRELKNYKGQADAYMITAQCEKTDEKINESLSKAEDRILKDEGPFSPKLLQVYGLRMKLQRSKVTEYSEKAKHVCRKLYQNDNPEKYNLVQAMAEEIQ